MGDERTQVIPGFIGGYLYELGWITVQQLDAALDRQLALSAQGRALRLGQVLVEMGAISRRQLEQALERQSADKDKGTRPSQGKGKVLPPLE